MKQQEHWAQIDQLLALALAEDVGPGDATTEALIPVEAIATAHYVARVPGVLAGLEVAERLLQRLDCRVTLTRVTEEGEHFRPEQILATVTGPARAILTGERISLNLLQRMSGVATITRRYVEAVGECRAKVCDTRKTMPGMRSIDKLAVYIGGGMNHRQGLYDMVMIKDNHLRMAGLASVTGSVASSISLARQRSKLPIMVEVDRLDQLREALELEPDYVLLDNMDLDTLREAVRLANAIPAQQGLRRPQLEASGGVTLETVRAIAETGVDRISVGALTHSAPSLDIGLDFA